MQTTHFKNKVSQMPFCPILTWIFLFLAENADEIEQQKTMEEYKIWKKNSPFFYDTLYSHALTWPSPTVEWMPNRDV